MQTLSSPPPDGPLAFILKHATGVIESEIRGPSMGMTLPPGTRIRIQCGASATRARGAVVAFVGYRGLVGHRVVGHMRDGQGKTLLLTRGDGLLACDPPLDPERVLGEVTEWTDGNAWLPLPAPPRSATGRRVAQSMVLQLVKAAAILVTPAFAARVSEWLLAASRTGSPS